ncbi:hypothetical protein OPT61_g1222 [Boeremia exigua]|uniref:Uncharacterized protein n=1 Tax=Boeremia exigua TaxID=749465 RepID=A0ACC2IR37_9PLEO|nr:hypothetical protein OPT61_g1222 [Boeremia exigua]
MCYRDEGFQATRVDSTLEVFKVTQHFFHHGFTINASFYMIVLSVFDALALEYSAGVHDRDLRLVQRGEITWAIDGLLNMFHQASLITRPDASSRIFDMKIIQSHHKRQVVLKFAVASA